MSATHVMAEIEQSMPDGGGWTDFEKASTLAALVIGLRPAIVVEIGVFLGGSLLPMLIAIRHLGRGKVIAIDPWSIEASVAGETTENVEWWLKVDHDEIYHRLLARIERHEVTAFCEVWRRPSDDCEVPAIIDLTHIDGNHRDQAVRDAERFLPAVRIGGIAILDDVGWVGGNVSRAVEIAHALGFVDLYPLGTGLVLQRTASSR